MSKHLYNSGLPINQEQWLDFWHHHACHYFLLLSIQKRAVAWTGLWSLDLMPWSESSWEKGTASFGLHLGALAFKLIVPPMKIAKTANSKGEGGGGGRWYGFKKHRPDETDTDCMFSQCFYTSPMYQTRRYSRVTNI